MIAALLWGVALAPLAAAAEPLALAYDDALQRALDGNPAALGASADLRRADGALLAARAVFDPQLVANADRAVETRENLAVGGAVAETDSLRTNGGATLSSFLPTGTTAALSFLSSQNRTLYAFADAEEEALFRQLGLVNENPFFFTNLSATLSQSLLQGHRMAWNLRGVRQATRGRDAAALVARQQQQAALADAARAYWALWTQLRLVDIARQSLNVALEEQKITTVRVEQGVLAPVERSRVDAAVVQARSALLDAENAARGAADALLIAIGEAPGREVQLLTPPAELAPVTLDAEALVAVAIQGNPQAEALRLALDHANRDLADARHALLPELSGRVSYGINGFEQGDRSAAIAEMFEGQLNSWSVGADLSVPLFNRADRGSLDSARAAAQRAEIDLRAFERTLGQQVLAQVRTLESARLRVDLAAANLRLAEDTLAAERALAEAGRSLPRDVLAAMRGLDDAKVALERARADWQAAIVALEQLKGTL